MFVFDQLKRDDHQLRLLAGIMFIGCVLLCVGLWYIQIVSARHYQENLHAQAQRTVRVPAVRGKILDRNGRPIVQNQPVFNLDLYLADLSPYFRSNYSRIKKILKPLPEQRPWLQRAARYQAITNITERVSRWLDQPIEISETNFNKHFSTERALPLPIMRDLSIEQVARFAEKPQSIPGLDLRVEAMRIYPHGSTAAHIVGYMTRDDRSVENEDAYFHYRLPDWKGKSGLERMYDKQLRGLAGTKSITVNYLSYRVDEAFLRDPDPGGNVMLTIDLRIQSIAEHALRSTDFGDAVKGAVVVMDPRNGDVLAMASAPTFNPQIFTGRISRHSWTNYYNNPDLRPLVNRCTQHQYHPGSIFKIVTALAALETGQLDPAAEIVNTGSYRPHPNARPVADTAPAGRYNLRRGFIRSSNVYFIEHGVRPGVKEKMIQLGQRLHLGEETSVWKDQETGGNPQEIPGKFPKPADLISGWRSGDTVNLSIGQGPVSVTPLQMAVMTSAVANGGKVLWPRLVMKVLSNDPESGVEPQWIPPARIRDHLGVSPANIQILHDIMRADVDDRKDGSGWLAHNSNISIGGKTGTAEIEKGGKKVGKTTWFTSFAPVEAPRYAVVVMVESGASGGKTCAPVAGRIYQKLLELEEFDRQNVLAQAN
jgi:penicillin-binding protein 2